MNSMTHTKKSTRSGVNSNLSKVLFEYPMMRERMSNQSHQVNSTLLVRRLASTLATRKGETTDHARRLVEEIHTVLNQAIKAGGSSLRDHRQTSGELGYFQHSFQVYDREGEKCQTPRCGGTIRRFNQNGRSTFWCSKCQK